ncbi:hypothetical protein MIND_00507500 [Mycena indigotica]|uniref:Uncharacterized protein n=1 Tax=Mycena indigotica TaxID=2126181 RepID=A0A8H6W8P1_9AGAR|nr:uncharacterized protein MIND_00507500 [Mycena indigotica]KAF7307141.1 hypothetical protein MIND_00507500 [Mycena indigotica]
MPSDDDQPQPEAGPSRVVNINYDPKWMDRTFSSRRKIETLLGPELGTNITRRDYELLMHTLPGLHYTDFLGIPIGVGVWLAAGNRRTKFAWKAGAFVAGAASMVAGEVLRLYTHTKIFKRIENKHGFSRAMDNVKLKVGFSPGLVSFTGKFSEDEAEQAFAADPVNLEPDAPIDSPPRAIPSLSPSPSPQQPAYSRWDEIRANRNKEGNKAWENIRKGRRADGSSIQNQSESPPETPSSSNSQPVLTPFRDEDRAAAQAAFDALVDRERNMRT